MEQSTFAELEHDTKKGRTRREVFLEKMDALIPWDRLEARIEPGAHEPHRRGDAHVAVPAPVRELPPPPPAACGAPLPAAPAASPPSHAPRRFRTAALAGADSPVAHAARSAAPDRPGRPWLSHPTHRWCPCRQRPPSREGTESPLIAGPYGPSHPAPPRGFPDETPPRLLPALPLSRAARTGSREHDRTIHFRPARPRRQTTSSQVRSPRRRGERTRAGNPAHRSQNLLPRPHGARAQTLRHRRQRRHHDEIPEARREARRLIASYIEPAKQDNGPRAPGHPMTAFAEDKPRKDVWLRPLRRDWKRILSR